MESHDVVIIGAGIYGLAAAKTFRQLNPDKSLVILDSGSSLGGVWSKERHYPGLKTNNMLGTYEFPDFPMDSDEFGVKPGEHIPGEAIHQYLTEYARKFGILSNIRYRCKVDSAEHQAGPEGGWILNLQQEEGQDRQRIYARKLVVATGMTSEPVLPTIAGQEQFESPLFHSKDVGKHADTLESAKRLAVLGGAKSAWDFVYAYASRGVQVDWIIRESGHGPMWMAPPYVTPLKKRLEKLVHRRLTSWFSPCIWGDVDGYPWARRFLHSTALGRAITNTFWGILGNDVLTLNQYDSHPEVQKLKPWTQVMFIASGVSILNYPTNIFDLVRSGVVRVHIADVKALSARKVHLSDGTQLSDVDAFCCATGWKHVPPVRFVLSDGSDATAELGIPHDPAQSSIFTPQGVQEVDDEILRRFPRLRDQPVMMRDHLATNTHTQGQPHGAGSKDIAAGSSPSLSPSTAEEPLTPWTLYRFIVPPSGRFLQTRDIAFAGVPMCFITVPVAHVQALWISAYFDGQLPSSVIPRLAEPELEHAPPRQSSSTNGADPKAEEASPSQRNLAALRKETLLHARFCRWRYPQGRGTQFPDFVFDALPYIDLLERDLGLAVGRKKKQGRVFGWWTEVMKPYGPEDYRNIVEEYIQLRKGEGR
ncbi:hypothetical protein VTJ83DRAFT_4454 [Remersonia thermophila]|uniref:Uncharacterized protein n=1 Tax=Remersonia thermophila TaxID=72144 RepID=A0ABR4DA67_9PEZI